VDESPLDNPVWHALVGPHQRFSLTMGEARRYLPDIAPFAAVATPTAERLEDVARFVSGGDGAAVLSIDPIDAPPGIEIASTAVVLQMIAPAFLPAVYPLAVIEPRAAADVPAMRALVELTRPGPFGARTIEMGRYLGIKQGGRLVAMAGERMRLDGYTEVSAVCVHPDSRGRGYAKALVSAIGGGIVAKGDVPFLHVYPDNQPAIAAYEALGFTGRRRLHFSLFRRATWG
jgi:ribosomal protein S18 acetylase RimI-like enzyme